MKRLLEQSLDFYDFSVCFGTEVSVGINIQDKAASRQTNHYWERLMMNLPGLNLEKTQLLLSVGGILFLLMFIP
ncbi:MAG: hypothetical protein AAGF26_18260 [Cyanobacteria bacterium P01_G01_bin.49]